MTSIKRQPANIGNSPKHPPEILDSEDEEVRRAREMAMAVAALGSGKGKSMKAEDIRMAVADVMRDPEENIKKEEKIKAADPQLNPQSSPVTQHVNSKGQNNRDITSTTGAIILSTIEDILRPPWNLRDQNFLLLVVLANITIIYVTVSSSSSLVKCSNAIFVFNMSVAIICATEKKNLGVNVVESVEMDFSDTAATNKYKQKREQENLVDEIVEQMKSRRKIILEWLPDVNLSKEDLDDLYNLQPDSTLAERRRFLKARKGCVKAASSQLGSYLLWRCKNKIDEFFPSTFTTDEEDWQSAARGAKEIENSSLTPASQKKLPRIVSVYGEEEGVVMCNNGARVVHVFPCLVDTNIVPATTYALALAMYLDRQLDRNYTEKVTVVIDIRAGEGWPNPSSVSLVPFIKLVVGSLNSYFPERLSRCILFPLPTTATLLFNRAKSYLDPDTATKIQVCSGAGSINSKIPDKVQSFIDQRALTIMERRRKSFFVK